MAKQKSNNDVPDYLSSEWSDYVLSQFHPSELKDGNPLVSGLRRVAELLLGDIIQSRPVEVSPVQGEGLGRSTVTYLVEFDWKMKPGQTRVYADVADVWDGNTDDQFCIYAPATASTRAEARALRKALKLKGVAAEELCTKDASKVVANDKAVTNERVTKEQINYLNTKCKKLNIDVFKFINSGVNDYNSIWSVTRDSCIKMIKALASYSDKDSVPENLIGYKEDWI